jgi:glycosyltransferase involved in cell wall biosynthesis
MVIRASPAPQIIIDATPLQNEHARRGIGTYVRALLAGLDESDLPGWGVLAYPGPLPVAHSRHRVRPVVPRRPRLLQFHGGWVLDQLLLPRRLRGTALFHATDPSRVPGPTNVRVVATVYDLTPLHDPAVWRSMWPDQQLGWRQSLANIRHASAVVVISQAAARDVVDFGIAPSRVHVVYPSIRADTAPIGDMTSRDADHLLVVAAPDPHKNVDVVLRALAELQASRRPRLTIVGPWSRPAQERLLARAEQLRLDRVRIEADVPMSRLATLYRTVTATIIPSRHEGFSLPLLEAMANGCPVVATDIPVLLEVAAGAALQVPPNDAQALSETIDRVLVDADCRSRLAEAGVRRAADFHPRRSVDALLECYRALGFDPAA